MNVNAPQNVAYDRSGHTLHDRVYRQIARWLAAGEFPPESLLTIRTLAARLGTSAMPVRAALSRLAAARALVPGPNRSFRVPPVTSQRLRELAHVRAALEGLAAETAASNLLDREIDRLVFLNRRMVEATRNQDQAGYFASNYDFHWTIYHASGEKLLVDIIEDLWLQNGPIHFFVFRDFSIFSNSTDRHDRIVAALKARNGPAAREALVHDIVSANDYVIEHLDRLQTEIGAAKAPKSSKKARR